MSPTRWVAWWPMVLLGALGACQSATPPPAPATPGKPALRVRPSEASNRELQATVARMLNVPAVAVAPDALLHDSLMVIEKARPRGADGLQLSGRDFDQPESFRLLTDGALCILVRLRTGSRERLHGSQCVPVD